MNRKLKHLVKRCLPPPLRRMAGAWLGAYKMAYARRAYRGGQPTGHLPAAELDALMKGDFRPPDAICYDAEGLSERALEKVGQIRARVPLDEVSDCLELGCMDGMVGAELVRLGKHATGLDLEPGGFDARARGAGVRLEIGSADAMPLADASFDLVYSFAAFEHFERPERVIAEAYRVLRPGGYLYLYFGPVYTSPYGRHAYREIPVPYCHYLFSEETLIGYARRHGLRCAWPYVNGWTVSRYRRAWQPWRGERFTETFYKEHSTGGVGAELIGRWPGPFIGKADSVDEFFVSAIELCWKKNA